MSKTIYQCPQGIVRVIRKTKGLRRWPPSKYPCGLFILRAKAGTRVAWLADGALEYMPSFDELRAMLEAIDPQVANLFPKHLKNKPRSRQRWWARRNWHRRSK